MYQIYNIANNINSLENELNNNNNTILSNKDKIKNKLNFYKKVQQIINDNIYNSNITNDINWLYLMTIFFDDNIHINL